MEPDGLWHVHKSVPLVPVRSQINPVHTIPSYLFKIEYIIFLPSAPVSSMWCHSLASNVLFAQEIPCCICTQFLLVFRRAHISLYPEQNDVSPHP